MADENTYSEKEEKIFQAAMKEFASYGKKGARMHAIADEAGCNKALVHYYFRNKEKLFREVSQYVFTDYLSALNDAVTEAPTFKEMLKAFVATYIDYLKEYGVYPLLMYRGMNFEELKERHARVIDEVGNTPSIVFVNKVNEAIEDGEIREVAPYHAFMSIMGSCMYLFVAHPVLSISHEEIENNIDQTIEERKEHIVDLMYNGFKK